MRFLPIPLYLLLILPALLAQTPPKEPKPAPKQSPPAGIPQSADSSLDLLNLSIKKESQLYTPIIKAGELVQNRFNASAPEENLYPFTHLDTFIIFSSHNESEEVGKLEELEQATDLNISAEVKDPSVVAIKFFDSTFVENILTRRSEAGPWIAL